MYYVVLKLTVYKNIYRVCETWIVNVKLFSYLVNKVLHAGILFYKINFNFIILFWISDQI